MYQSSILVIVTIVHNYDNCLNMCVREMRIFCYNYTTQHSTLWEGDVATDLYRI